MLEYVFSVIFQTYSPPVAQTTALYYIRMEGIILYFSLKFLISGS